MITTCHSCGAFDPTGTQFLSERIPFRGTHAYCPKCHAKLEEKFLFSILIINVVFALIGIVCLRVNPSSKIGHVFVNLALIQLVILSSVIIHEFAHAIVGKRSGLTVLKIWIGRGKTLFRVNIFGFDTEFKMIPYGGLTFLTHGFKEKLRFRYFLAVMAGPFANAIILLVAWKYSAWRNFNLEATIQLGTFIVLAQALILMESLLPYRIQTALGQLSTDGLSLFQLLTSKSPDVLTSRLGNHIVIPDHKAQTWIK